MSFTVGHLVVSKVRDRFDAYGGTIVTDEILERSSVNPTIDASSVDTHLAVRDNQIRSADFLDVEHFPNITFLSSAVQGAEHRNDDQTPQVTTAWPVVGVRATACNSPIRTHFVQHARDKRGH